MKKSQLYALCCMLFSIQMLIGSIEYSPNEFLLISAEDHDLTGVQKALEYGAYIDYQDSSGWTALHHAAYNLDAKTILFLLKYGANQSLKNTDGLIAYNLLSIDRSRDRFRDQEMDTANLALAREIFADPDRFSSLSSDAFKLTTQK